MDLVHELGHSFGLHHSWSAQFSDIYCPHCSAGSMGSTCELPCAALCNSITDPDCYNNIWNSHHIFLIFRVRGFIVLIQTLRLQESKVNFQDFISVYLQGIMALLETLE